MGFSKKECWSGLPFPPPGGLLSSGIEPVSLVSPALAGKLFTAAPTGKPVTNTGQAIIVWPNAPTMNHTIGIDYPV